MSRDFAKQRSAKSNTGHSGRGGKSNSTKGKQAKTAGTEKAKSRTSSKKGASLGQSDTPPPLSRGQSFLAWLALLTLAGGFIYGLYYLKQVDPEPSSNRKTPPASSAANSTDKTASPAEKRFKFYDILPEAKVETSPTEAYHYREKSVGKYTYTLQTGSFRQQKDAEKQKALIAFQGMKAIVNPPSDNTSGRWYRVTVGPFKSRSKMNKAIDKLVNINIQPLVKKNLVEKTTASK